MTARPVMLVTGGGRGIGAAIARLAGARGYDVGVNYRSDAASANAVVAEIEANGARAVAIPGDVSREDEVVEIFAMLDRELGGISALANNAGVTGGAARVEAVTQAQIERVFAVNVTGAFLCAREAVKRMSTAKGGSGGAIVNISSGAAKLGSPGVWVHYAASKGALDTFTLGLAREVAADGIRVNGLRVGITDTDLHAFAEDPEKLTRMSKVPPMQRVATPEEIAESALWLLSDQASYVSAALVDAGGGM